MARAATPDFPTPAVLPAGVLTARGQVAVTVIRLRRQLAVLDSADRAYIAAMLRDMLAAGPIAGE